MVEIYYTNVRKEGKEVLNVKLIITNIRQPPFQALP